MVPLARGVLEPAARSISPVPSAAVASFATRSATVPSRKALLADIRRDDNLSAMTPVPLARLTVVVLAVLSIGCSANDLRAVTGQRAPYLGTDSMGVVTPTPVRVTLQARPELVEALQEAMDTRLRTQDEKLERYDARGRFRRWRTKSSKA